MEKNNMFDSLRKQKTDIENYIKFTDFSKTKPETLVIESEKRALVNDYIEKVKTDPLQYDTIMQDFYDNVIEDMTSNLEYYKKQYFKLFLGGVLPFIKEEMYNEFKTHISDSDFDLYMRKAVMKYELGV
jgi:hypothetical protein